MQKFTVKFDRNGNEDLINLLSAWDKSIPTLYILDACSIAHVKDFNTQKAEALKKVEKYIPKLQSIDMENNVVSCFIMLQEKVSECQNNLSVEELVKQSLYDLAELKKFFKNASIQEDENFVKDFIENCYNHLIEEKRDIYLALLKFANGLSLYNQPPQAKRVEAIEKICLKANELGIDRDHIICLAIYGSIYGCVSAKNVLKFSKKIDKFKASNALADIMSIQTVGEITHALTNIYRVHFLTDDNALQEFYEIFFVNQIDKTLFEDGGQGANYTVTTNAKKLFPFFFNNDGSLKNELVEEYDNLFKLISIK